MSIAVLIETRATFLLIDSNPSSENIPPVSCRSSRVFSWTVIPRYLGSPFGIAWLSSNGGGSEKSCRKTARHPQRRRTTICCRCLAALRSRQKWPQNTKIERWGSKAFSARCPPPRLPHVRPQKSCLLFSHSRELTQKTNKWHLLMYERLT